MARVADLVKDGDECLLEHPEIGKVRWSDHTDNSNGQKWSLEMGGYLGGFMLIFTEGIDKNKPLVVDSAVLHEDNWTKIG